VGPLCEKLCWLNDHKDFAKRHLIVVSFDSPNHGSRLVDEKANYGWKEKGKENERHGLDMWSMLYGTSRTVSELMDVIEHYLFGPLERPRVEAWGVVGFSMGGHASFLAAAEGTEPVHGR
jgi:pimeloyl-ACP methyl ester carboxylesterase